jgi:DNA processing protein
MYSQAAFWITIAHLPKWSISKRNDLIKRICVEKSSSLEEFFALDPTQWEKRFNLNFKDVEALQIAKGLIANNEFLAKSLSEEGCEIIPIISEEYSPCLRNNLNLSYAPSILYIKGDKNILQEKSVAIVGARDANDLALQFTDNVAKKAVERSQVVVSGFARGVDKRALNSVLKYKGKSIIVLPQGIMTFKKGIKDYAKQISDGDVLVLSTFYPKATWNAGFALLRNSYIYGLAEEIFIAQSSEKGGTWSGAIDGLKKGRKVFIREPLQDEKSANHLLIEMGGTPVDIYGNKPVSSNQSW